uniref:Uncharacterized protein n=1 Tax=Plectus sambesii TaxID=2011161 RepID=A0A914UIB9_9BILA
MRANFAVAVGDGGIKSRQRLSQAISPLDSHKHSRHSRTTARLVAINGGVDWSAMSLGNQSADREAEREGRWRSMFVSAELSGATINDGSHRYRIYSIAVK